MNRGMRDGGGSRSRMGMGGDYGGSMRNYSSQGGSSYGSQGVLGSSPAGLLGHGLGGGAGGFGSGAGSSSYEMDNLLQQRTLQQQLTLRESQLALANSLLQQQQQSSLMEGPGMGMRGGPGLGIGGLGSGMMMNKRRPDLRHGDYQPEFKRPRNDFRSHSYSQPRDRYRGRDSDGGNRSFNSRRNQSSSPSSRPYRSDRDTSDKGRKDTKEEYDPEKPTADEDEKKDDGGDQFHCHVCNVNCRDDEGFRRHMNSTRHKNRMLGVLSIHEEKVTQIASRMKAEKHLRHLEDEDKSARGYCKVCDVVLQNIRYPEHQRMTFHRKRVMQVTKGCGWCNVSSFKNFTEVLAHRETEEHKKNQVEHEKTDGKSRSRRDSDRRGDRSDGKPVAEKRAPIKVEMPANLAKFDSEVAVGQSCVVPVSGFFCKLCNKFYNNETAAKETHCKTEPHFGKYKRFIYAKLRAKAEEERDAKEKAEEEEKKKKAAADKEKDGEKGENGTAEMDDSLEESKEEQDIKDGDDEAMEDDEGKEEDDEGEEEDEVAAAEEEEEENAMLAADASALDFSEDADMEDESLLNETEENSAYHTADDSAVAGANEDVDESGVSISTGENASQFLQDTTQEDSLADDAEATLGEEEDETDGKKRATRATVTSSSTRARGRGRGAGVNKARRGRKVTK